MTMQRLLFQVSTGSTPAGDTGGPVFGEILQFRWSPTGALDTGADLEIGLLPKMGDSGDGFLFYNDNDCLGVDFTRSPRVPMHAADGFDTGVDAYTPVVAAGDRVRIKIRPAGGGVAGRLYVWVRN